MSGKNKNFFAKKRQAEETFGKSSVRPQDHDKGLAAQCRHTNLGIEVPVPENYAQDVESKIVQFVIPALMDVPNTMKSYEWVSEGRATDEISYQLTKNSIFSVDFEMHNDHSYDGFLCVASLSTGIYTYVVDCLFDQRKPAKKFIAELFTSDKCLKVMCGNSNDLTRLRKDWKVFPHLVIDVQDLFVIFAQQHFQKCVTLFGNTVRNRLKAAGKPVTDTAVIQYLQNLHMPGLNFLIEGLLPHLVPKHDLCTFADWRKRDPLHTSLRKYAAEDAFLTLKVYEKFVELVGINGIRGAMLAGMKKLFHVGALARYSTPTPTNSGHWSTHKRIMEWRIYLAKNLDKKPGEVLHESKLVPLLEQIHLAHLNVEEVHQVLIKLGVGDHPQKSAKLLWAFVEEDARMLESMRTIICHRCNVMGHTARFCYQDLEDDELRDCRHQFMHRPENKTMLQKRNNDNWIKYCLRKGLNPDTAKKPWK